MNRCTSDDGRGRLLLAEGVAGGGPRGVAHRGARFVGLICAGLLALGALCSPASADKFFLTTTCGAPISSTVKQGIDLNQTISATNTYVNLQGAAVSVVVPAGQTRCVRIRFSVVLICNPPNAISRCFLKVSDTLSPFVWDPSIAVATEEVGGAHSYEWAARLSAGVHPIRIQATKNTGVTFLISSWTMSVDVAK